MHLRPSSSVIRSSEAIDAELDGEVVAMNVAKGVCYGLNRVGSRVWQLIAVPMTVSEICATLMREYEVDAETCRQQVTELLEGLRREELVHVTDPAEGA